MTDKKKRIGHDPFSEPRGVNSLIMQTDTQSTQDTQGTHDAQGTQDARPKGRRQKLPRINMAFDPDQLQYLRVMAGLNGISITRYIYNLVQADMAANVQTYEKVVSLKGGKQ